MSEIESSQCPGCGASFTPKRSNQAYCSRLCQRKASRNSARGNRSAENKQRSWKHYERAARLTEMIYSVPPHERLGMMQHILSFIPHDAGLRNILTDPELHMKPPKADSRKNVTKAADAYTKKFFGLSIRRYINAVRTGQKPQCVELES